MGVTSFSAGAGTSISQANQAALESETNQDTYIPPDLIKYSPGVAKFWVKFDGADGSGTVNLGHNVTSVSDDGAGDYTVTIATDFSGAHWAATANARTAGAGRDTRLETMAAGTLRVLISATSAGEDATYVCVAGFGDHA